MSRGTAGSLVVSLGLDAAEYVRGLTKAEYDAKKFGESLGAGIRSAALVGSAAISGIAASAAAASAAFNELLEGAAKFQDLADETGASAEGIASLAVAAGTAGVSIESVAGSMVKLTKGLSGVDDESKAAGAALGAIGIEVSDFKKLDPVAQYEAISKGLAGYADGAGKTAVAVALFGKAGAEQLKVMKAIEEQGGRTSILTAEQISLADDYLDRQAKLRAELTLYASAIATQFVEPTNILIGLVRDSAKEFINAGDQVNAFGINQGVQNFAENAGRALAEVIDYIKTTKSEFGALTDFLGSSIEAVQKYSSFDFAGGRKVGEDFRKKYGLDELGRKIAGTEGAAAGETYVEKYNAQLARNRSDRNRSLLNQSNNPNAGKDLRAAVQYDGPAKKGGADDPTKKALDNALKDLERGVKQQQDILSSRNKMLDLYNGENLISTQAYYEGRRVAMEDNVAKESAIYDQQIERLKAFQSSAAKATDREEAQGKINELVEKKAKLYRDAGEAALEMGFKERKSAEDLQKQLNAVNADVLELTGNLSAASKIRLDAQYEDLSKRLSVNGDSAGQAQLDRLKQLKTAQAESVQQSEEISRITASLQVQEDRISLSRQIGADTELSSLVKTGEARRAAVAQIQAYVTALETIAKTSESPALAQNAERARVELEKLQAVADPLGDKFNAIFVDSFGNAFADFITGSKTASEAFQAFGRSVINQLANIAAQEAATALFGKSTKGGSSGLFGSLFSLGSMALGDYTGTSIGGTYGTSTQALLDAKFASLSGKAGGGSVAANSLHEVNENGPELLDYAGRQYLMMGDKAGRVIANGGAGTGETNWSIVNQTSGRVDNVVEQRVSPTERVLIMQETRKQVWAELSDRNSMGSKAMSRNFNLQRA